MDRIHVVGLGPGPLKYLTAEAQQLLASARHLVLKTAHHAAAAELRRKGVVFSDLDILADGRSDEESATEISDWIRHEAAERGEIVYAVPRGRVLADPSVGLLLAAADVDVSLHGGPGEVELVSIALGRPLDAVQLVDATRVGKVPILPSSDVLVSALTTVSSEVLAERLRNVFSDEQDVWIVAVSADGVSTVQSTLSKLGRDVSTNAFCLFVPARTELRNRTFDELVALMSRLRGPDGCLWDREQTHKSLARHLIEEAYEAVDAIECGDDVHLIEELGDVLLQIVFHAQIASDERRFAIGDVLEGIITKLIRRHPHIFADVEVSSPADVEINWERIKREEKQREGSALSGVLPALPALMYAEKLQSKAARIGFDWEEYSQVIDKVKEELAEVVEAKERGGDVEAEVGDVLFAVVNLARFLDVDCETALRGVCARFMSRFGAMEELAAERGVSFADLPLAEKEKLWQEAKGLQTGS